MPVNNVTTAAEKMKPVVDMYKIFSTSTNPMQLLQTAASNNEQFKEVAQQISNFTNPREAFMEEARRRGLTNDDIQNGLTQMESLLGIKRN